MFKRKLTALKHPNPETFNLKDELQFKNTVVWLEDQRIRHYKVDDRQRLRNIKSQDWIKHFHKYLDELQCPIEYADIAGVMDWLLGWAVHVEYGDKSEVYKEKTAANVTANKQSAPRIVAANPLDNMSFDSDDFKSGVTKLAALLKITKHPDHLVTLKAVCQMIRDRMSTEVMKNPNEHIINGKPMPLQEYDLGFDTGDYVLNQAAKIMRLLFIKDLRDLQTNVNEIIVAIQAITANPKTDSSLGKVGI